MRLTPREPEIPEVGGFTAANDIFGYREFADRLANLVGNIDEPLVIALDGPWGSGKSVFIRQWAGLLRERGASVIEFDAFRNDHCEDAFLAIASAIHATAKEELGGNESTTRRYLNRAKKAGTVLAPIALRVASRAGTAGLLGLEDVEAGNETIKSAIRALGNESAKALEKVVSERLRNANEERAVLDTFRETLSEVAVALSEKKVDSGPAFPLVIIIDELDRCRPPFALSVIERVKHLFSVPGVYFVLVTHLPQLEQAIQGAYGTTFDARTYLEKFYQLRFVLPENRDRPGNFRAAYAEYLWRELEIQFPESRHAELTLQEIQGLARTHELSLRQLERVMTHIVLVTAALRPERFYIAPIAAGLCVMRLTHPELYNKAKVHGLNWVEVSAFLQPTEGQGVQGKWALGWWKFCTGADMTKEELSEYKNSLRQYNLDDGKSVIQFMADYIESLVQRAD